MDKSLAKSKEDFIELQLQPADKIIFIDELLFSFTITARGICSEVLSTDAEKLEALKWLNELVHRIWNLRFDIQQDNYKDFGNRLFDNFKFHCEESKLLCDHLESTILNILKNFKKE